MTDNFGFNKGKEAPGKSVKTPPNKKQGGQFQNNLKKDVKGQGQELSRQNTLTNSTNQKG